MTTDAPAGGDARPRPDFPGGTSVSELDVYDGVAPDGLAGGTPHLHAVSTEAYVVVAGEGAVQTIDASGFRETMLAPGSVVWFSPGVIHRAINRGGLSVRVIMQNAGLPEAGDAVMTFPDEVLADPSRYAEVAALPGADAPEADRIAAAMRRRDLAVAGFAALRRTDGGVDADALARLYERAGELVAPRVPAWRALWEASVARIAAASEAQFDALAVGYADHLADGRVATVPTTPAFGMCGRLRRFEPAELVDLTDLEGNHA
ncbi:cupin domain-containing protein [Agromyces sp. SYSU T00194]|uniref:cupin domain-containing protein n=1 Tax=Agromyces chitinivorans TaxID=3158560 RepID=UPI00339B1C94